MSLKNQPLLTWLLEDSFFADFLSLEQQQQQQKNHISSTYKLCICVYTPVGADQDREGQLVLSEYWHLQLSTKNAKTEKKMCPWGAELLLCWRICNVTSCDLFNMKLVPGLNVKVHYPLYTFR